MDKQEIIDNQTKEVILTTLDRLKTRLYRDVADAFESQGSQFGAQLLHGERLYQLFLSNISHLNNYDSMECSRRLLYLVLQTRVI
jgi:hypothetical protein